MHLSVFELRLFENLCLVPAELGREAVRLFTERGDFLEVVLQLGRKVGADGQELLHPTDGQQDVLTLQISVRMPETRRLKTLLR